MSFKPDMYKGFIAADSPAQKGLIRQYEGTGTKFDIIIVGSGVGGGVLADALASLAKEKKLRILVLEAGSFLYPTHVYNLCRFLNHKVAERFECGTFSQQSDFEDAEFYIGRKPQLNFGGRSIFWSGLIPALQKWELDFFPPRVREDLVEHPNPLKRDERDLLHRAGEKMNQSVSMGRVAEEVVKRLCNSWLAADFVIEQTPRALHQPYLRADGTPKDEFFTEPTGVFNTAELLINQLGLYPGTSKDSDFGIHLLLNHFVQDVQNDNGRFNLVVRDTLAEKDKTFQAGKVVLAAGSIESPKLLLRSRLYDAVDDDVKKLVGRGLTDHPATDVTLTHVDGIGGIELTPQDHFKIIFYTRGLRDGTHEIRYPFNVEMNFNHEYWHLRKNDPADPTDADRFGTPPPGKSVLDIKFSFGNCLDDKNEVKAAAPPSEYVSEIVFHNTRRVERLAGSRFPALAGWHKEPREIWDVLNAMTRQIFSLFRIDGKPAEPKFSYDGGNGRRFGYGTVHHAAGSLRMPWYQRLDQLDKNPNKGVVDEDLRVNGTKNLYVCDMSVMPISTAANPVRTLVALALRLSEHLAKLT
jgi:GMC oxidoreductase